MREEDMEVVRFRESNAFHTDMRIYRNAPPITMQISFCDARDLSPYQSEALARHSSHLALKIFDVARGRLDSNILNRYVAPRVVVQIDNFRALAQNRVVKNPLFLAHLPVQVRRVHAMVLHSSSFEAWVTMNIGNEYHWADLVLTRIGMRWMCTTLQLG